jgi:glutathione S-transferase
MSAAVAEGPALSGAILYDSVGPNPRVVRMFAAEKHLRLERTPIDIVAGANRRPEFLRKNPAGGIPVLELDDGVCISETLAICEYLEELAGASSLIGATPVGRARVRMWTRRIDLGFCAPLVLSFRGSLGRAMFEPRMVVVGESAAGDLKGIALDYLSGLEPRLLESEYVAGGDFTLADILLFCFLEFGVRIGLLTLDGMPGVEAWRDKVRSRPSAAA